MGLFDKNPSFSRDHLKNAFKKSDTLRIGGRRFSQVEREKIFRETFGNKFDISKNDYKKAVSKLSQEQRKTTDSWKKRTMNERIKFLKEFEKK